jgi:hypothetical protein
MMLRFRSVLMADDVKQQGRPPEGSVAAGSLLCYQPAKQQAKPAAVR